tara:strand:- start:4550 stop:5794 length:1245 start_codon:yes stop_codon:yes gene_type:complete
MAKKKKEEPIANNETGSLKVKEKPETQPTSNETKGNVTKVKEKMKNPAEVIEESITKVDLNKPPKPEENETKENNADDSGVVASVENADATEKQEKVQPQAEAQEGPVLEEITVDGGSEEVSVEPTKEQVEKIVVKEEAMGEPLPENVQKLMNFMEETGGDLNDYVKLNQDYSKLDNQDLLYEYYKNTKPHLNAEEINFLMEDQFSFDEDVDEEKDIRRKKLALKEQVANAKTHLEETKSKYYDEIKSGSKLTSEQQEAINFYNESQKLADYEKSAKSNFLNRTNKFFGDQFKGFEYNVGEKNYRFNVNDVNKVKETQSDINNFIGKFLDKDRHMKDEAGYHKALFAAMNPDAVAKHFYEQGKVDALKQSEANAKNINMDPRQELGSNENTSGIKVRVLGETSNDFKFKIKNKK